MTDIERIAKGLSKAEKDWLISEADEPDTPIDPATAEWSDGDEAWDRLAVLGLVEFWTSRLTPGGLQVRAHLLAEREQER